MTKLSLALVCLCGLASGAVCAADPHAAPTRVVSLDFCADQFVLKLLPRERILAVSPDADRHFSYMRAQADGVRQVRPRAEDLLTLQPDLVVRSYGGGPRVVAFLERSGIAVSQVPYINDIDGIRDAILKIARDMGTLERGRDLVMEMDRRLAVVKGSRHERSVLYMTPNGVTSGPGTLVHEMIVAAGLSNFEEREGWHNIPLERLVYEQPDIIAAAFFDTDANGAALWSAMRHPVARRQMENLPTVRLPGAWTSCGAWFLLDAIEALAANGVARQ